MQDKQNVVVGVRIRPLNDYEQKHSSHVAWTVRDGNVIVQQDGPEPADKVTGKTNFTYDHVFGMDSTTEQLYIAMGQAIVDSSLQGYNGTIFAYGQTSSGKTHTLMGDEERPGVMVLAIHHIFEQIDFEGTGTEHLVRMSYTEIYNEQIRDLLRPDAKQLKIRQDAKKGASIDAKEEVVASAEDVMGHLAKGETNRHYGSTSMNANSSRSHTILRIVLESRKIVAANGNHEDTSRRDSSMNGGGSVSYSLLNLVDLAGSERQSKTGATGARLKEASNINRSLLTLGTVISELSKGAKANAYIPYRDSKLTQLLKTSLGGNAKTAMIAAISPSERNRSETKSTLRFALRAQKIVNHAQKNRIASNDSLLCEYKAQIAELQAQLQEQQSGGGVTDEMLKQARRESELRLQEVAEDREEQVRKADEARSELERMQKLIVISNELQQDRSLSPQHRESVQNNLVNVAAGRRRLKSVFVETQSLLEETKQERLEQHKTGLSRKSVFSLANIATLRRQFEEQEQEEEHEQETQTNVFLSSGSDSDSSDSDSDSDSGGRHGGDGPSSNSEEKKGVSFRQRVSQIELGPFDNSTGVIDGSHTAVDVREADAGGEDVQVALHQANAALQAMRQQLRDERAARVQAEAQAGREAVATKQLRELVGEMQQLTTLVAAMESEGLLSMHEHERTHGHAQSPPLLPPPPQQERGALTLAAPDGFAASPPGSRSPPPPPPPPRSPRFPAASPHGGGRITAGSPGESFSLNRPQPQGPPHAYYPIPPHSAPFPPPAFSSPQYTNNHNHHNDKCVEGEPEAGVEGFATSPKMPRLGRAAVQPPHQHSQYLGQYSHHGRTPMASPAHFPTPTHATHTPVQVEVAAPPREPPPGSPPDYGYSPATTFGYRAPRLPSPVHSAALAPAPTPHIPAPAPAPARAAPATAMAYTSPRAHHHIANIVVPEGSEGGHTIRLAGPDGTMLDFKLPEEVQPGDTIQLQVPAVPSKSTCSVPGSKLSAISAEGRSIGRTNGSFRI